MAQLQLTKKYYLWNFQGSVNIYYALLIQQSINYTNQTTEVQNCATNTKFNEYTFSALKGICQVAK